VAGQIEVDDVLGARTSSELRAMKNRIEADSEAPHRFALLLWRRDDLERVKFGQFLPGIGSVAPPALPERCSRRAYNILMRSGLVSWDLFARSTPAELRAIPNCGRESFLEILEVAVTVWAKLPGEDSESELRSDFPTSLVDHDASRSQADWGRSHDLVNDAERWLQWSWAQLGAATIGEALDLWSAELAPRELVETFERLAALDLSKFMGFGQLDERLWNDLLSFPQKEGVILERRILAVDEPTTLAALGEELGITRERVRQLERRARQTLEDRLNGDAAAPLLHAAAVLRRQLGPVAELGADVEACEAAVIATSTHPINDLELRRELLRQRCGPYVEIGGRVWSPEARRTLDATQETLARIGPGGVLESSMVDGILSALMVEPEQQDAVLESLDLKKIAGSVLRWTGSMSDKAAGALAAVGRPMAMLDLYELVETDRSPRSFANAVQTDKRVMRLGKDRYGLREWGGEEYSGIRRELEQAIDEAGGSANLDELIARFVAEFEVSESSVRAYAADRRFVRAADGTISFRTGDDPEPSYRVGPIETTRGAMRLNGIWHLRVEVDEDALRGSGRAIRTPVALAAGLEPDLTLGVRYGDVVVTFSWTRNQPDIGSVRGVLQQLSCVEGDLLFLPLEGDEPRAARAVRATERNREHGVRRLAIELGVDPDEADPASPGPLASAVGLPAGADYVDLEERLIARGENHLAALLLIAS
jgi:hypothetical protein